MVSLPEHDHCKNCGDPVPFDMAYCCEDCYWSYQGNMVRERRKMNLYVTAAVVAVAVLVTLRVLF